MVPWKNTWQRLRHRQTGSLSVGIPSPDTGSHVSDIPSHITGQTSQSSKNPPGTEVTSPATTSRTSLPDAHSQLTVEDEAPAEPNIDEAYLTSRMTQTVTDRVGLNQLSRWTLRQLVEPLSQDDRRRFCHEAGSYKISSTDEAMTFSDASEIVGLMRLVYAALYTHFDQLVGESTASNSTRGTEVLELYAKYLDTIAADRTGFETAKGAIIRDDEAYQAAQIAKAAKMRAKAETQTEAARQQASAIKQTAEADAREMRREAADMQREAYALARRIRAQWQ